MNTYIITYRQFTRGRRSIKKAEIPGENVLHAIEIFWKAIEIAKTHPALNFNHVRLISIVLKEREEHREEEAQMA